MTLIDDHHLITDATQRLRSALADGVIPTAPASPLDLYRDIHKGLRAELFAITGSAGSTDPTDATGSQALVAHLREVAHVLESHADHEDTHIDPAIAEVAPDLSELLIAQHHELDARFSAITEVGEALAARGSHDPRGVLQLLHLELSGFTGDYLRHLLIEEQVVMPLLSDALGEERVAAIHEAIVSSIPPAEMTRSLSFMLPAMNVADRADLLAGMEAGAPPEAFAGVLDLAASVLDPVEHRATLARIGRTGR